MADWITLTAWLPVEGWREVLDITLVSLLGWLTIGYFRRTHARRALAGLAILAGVYLVARGLDLRLSEALFQGFFAVVVLVLVVVFQEDLRRLFEQLGSWRPGREQAPPETETTDLLVRTAVRMAHARTGALIVLPGREPPDRHLEGGISLGGRVSEPLLLSIFDPSSPGHDGAVVIRGSTLERFAVHLPLSVNQEALGPGGTRHAAALGLAERCDAICIVVSEERGTVSVARNGTLRTLARPDDLAAVLRSALHEEAEPKRWWRGRVALDAGMAVAAALALWMVFVPGSDVTETRVMAPVEVTNLPGNLELESIDPASVEVTLRGLRRDLLLGRPLEVVVQIDAYLARLGRRTFRLSDADVLKPDAVSVVEVAPDKVKLSLRNAPSTERPPE